MGNPYQTQGAFSWFELITPNVEAAKKFYSELFGWQYEAAPMAPEYTVIKVDGQGAGGMMIPPPAAKECPPHWGMYITVTDIQSTVAKARQMGAKILFGPQAIEKVGTFAVIQDPQGAVVSAMQYVEM